MKGIFTFLMLFVPALFLNAQSSITVKFKAKGSDNQYIELSRVHVENVSKNWSQDLVYPDTTLILNITDGIDEAYVTSALLQNSPNPFHGTTESVLKLGDAEQTNIQLISLEGRVIMERLFDLGKGEHHIVVSLAEPQMVVLRVSTSKHNYAVKMLNLGNGGTNNIEVVTAGKEIMRDTKATGVGEFSLGDQMRYTGYTMHNGEEVASQIKTQAQNASATVTLVFDIALPKPVVTTSEVSEITNITAVCGGVVVNQGGSEVTARGICWAKTQNPTINSSHTTDGNGVGSFTSIMTDLQANTNYYVRAYATNSYGTSYGEQKTFHTLAAPQGALSGKFSINATTQVYFSQGNLQYQASTNTWRFAEHQWDTLGALNANVSSSYNGWIDLFGWGTGNNPTITSISDADYSTFIDWGTNPISNGGNTANQWRTLTQDEWEYLLFNRNTASGEFYAKATVNGVPGLIILPDDWQHSYYWHLYSNQGETPFSASQITLDDWTNSLEAHGAAFIPCGGYRYGMEVTTTTLEGYEIYGEYWSSTPTSSYNAIRVWFARTSLYVSNGKRYRGLAVRLVRE